nr:DUF4297 domain-containing protein [bacterium]
MSSPTDARDKSDPGDQVIRKFRYQHAYGVIVATMMLTKQRSYRAIWCEQHEDLLAEREDEKFDAIQVKTRKPETGAWTISAEAFVKSLKRFLQLNAEFPDKIERFQFVTNTEFSKSNAKANVHLSPIKLLNEVASKSSISDFDSNASRGFKILKELLGCDEGELLSILKRLDLVNGPTEKAFEDEICQSHLPLISECKGMSAGSLAKVFDCLMILVEKAADAQCADPKKHSVGITSLKEDPILRSKRIGPEQIILTIREATSLGVHYPENLSTLDLTTGDSLRLVLKEKMTRGGLEPNFEAMRRKALTAEAALIDLATRSGDGKRHISQVENVVLTECDEAYLRASGVGEPFGPSMLIDVQNRLKVLAKEEPSKIENQPYEVLVGVSGLLTDACTVWWSQKFDLEEKS